MHLKWLQLNKILSYLFSHVFGHSSLGPFLGCMLFGCYHSTLPANCTCAKGLPHSWGESIAMPVLGPLKYHNKNFRDTLKKLHGRSSSVFSAGQPSFSVVLISAFASKSLRCICVLCGNHAKQYLVCYYWKCSSLPRVLCFLRGRYRELRSAARCHLKVLPHVHKINSFTQGLCGNILKTMTSKEGRHPFRITRGARVSSERSWVCPHGPMTFSSSWVSLKTFRPMS